MLVKPQTFMNLSGKSVGPMFGFQKCTPTDLIADAIERIIGGAVLRTRLNLSGLQSSRQGSWVSQRKSGLGLFPRRNRG